MADLLSLFPSGSALDADGVLSSTAAAPTTLAAEFGTPVLVVAERGAAGPGPRVRRRARRRAGRDSRVVFASKAFPCTAVQRVMVEEGLGLDVAGGGEILTALKAGIDPALIVLHGNAKSDEEIAMAVEHGIGLVVVDNSDDVDRLEATVPAGRSQDVLIRIIPGVTADTHAHVLTGHEGSKFGLSPADAAAADQADRAQSAAADAGAARPRRFADPGRRSRSPTSVAPVAQLGEFPVYDLGGGLGARYTWADRAADGRRLPRRADRRGPGAPAGGGPVHHRARAQHGRPVAATTIYRVTTVKRGAVTFVAVDGGMGDNLEVALFEPALRGRYRRPVRRARHGDGDGRRPALRERRRAGRRRRTCPPRRWATCSPFPRPAPTATRWPTTTTATAGSRSSSSTTAMPGSSSDARPGTT